ncbi:MAG: SDR family NAD(P)-dependent oxidoreductase [Hyphomicrobiaceae bacterium]
MSSISNLHKGTVVDVERSKGRAIIAGGGSGIGEACANRLAKDDYAVAIVDLNAEGAEQVISDLSGAVSVISRTRSTRTSTNNPKD